MVTAAACLHAQVILTFFSSTAVSVARSTPLDADSVRLVTEMPPLTDRASLLPTLRALTDLSLVDFRLAAMISPVWCKYRSYFPGRDVTWGEPLGRSVAVAW